MNPVQFAGDAILGAAKNFDRMFVDQTHMLEQLGGLIHQATKMRAPHLNAIDIINAGSASPGTMDEARARGWHQPK